MLATVRLLAKISALAMPLAMPLLVEKLPSFFLTDTVAAKVSSVEFLIDTTFQNQVAYNIFNHIIF